MVVVLCDENGVVRVGMLVPAVGQEHDCTDVRRSAPELGEQLTAHANMFLPLIVFAGSRLGDRTPVEDRVNVREVCIERRDFMVKADLNGA